MRTPASPPAARHRRSPVDSSLAVAVVGSSAVAFGALYPTHSFSARTSTAVLGTLASLLLIAALGVTFTGAAQLTGVGDDTIGLAATLGREVDGPSLVMAGLVIRPVPVRDAHRPRPRRLDHQHPHAGLRGHRSPPCCCCCSPSPNAASSTH